MPVLKKYGYLLKAPRKSMFVRSLEFNFLILFFFFIIEWSASPVISAFGVNTESNSAEIWSPPTLHFGKVRRRVVELTPR